MSSHYDLTVILKNHTRRVTANKLLIFDLLDNHEALSTTELYEKVERKITYATYYRIIKEFRELNIIRDTVINGMRKIELDDRFGSHHHHLICVRCGEVTNINDVKLEQYLKLLAARKGYEHRTHSFEIQGLCPACLPRYRELAQQGPAVDDNLSTSHVAGHIRG